MAASESFHSRCEAELIVALRAKQRLLQLLDAGPIRIERHGRDRYGRTLAYVITGDGREAGEVLIAEGLAVEWKPGRAALRARALHWCRGFVGEVGQ